VQYTGFSPTTELETFRRFALARDVGDFRDALQCFDVGGQHFTYADVDGTIAYFTNAEVPVREDLQAGAVRGSPPYLLRDGTGGNEWLPVTHRQPHQSVPYEIVPFAELLATGGIGRSGIDFFAVPGIGDPSDRRDYLVLRSLADALDLAASDRFAPAWPGTRCGPTRPTGSPSRWCRSAASWRRPLPVAGGRWTRWPAG
jgi:hypothetical protein